MKRTLIVLLSILAIGSFSSVGDAQQHKAGAATAKISAVPCPTKLKNIKDCPDTGCGPSLDPNLNVRKNVPNHVVGNSS
jgi:hypothetical protein